jgi:arginyl-tRNA synthetase
MLESGYQGIQAHVEELLRHAIAKVAPAFTGALTLERPKQAQHGDFACSAALQLAKTLKRNPRDIAAALVAELASSPLVDRAEVAGAGFINIFLKPTLRQSVVAQILALGERYGCSQLGAGKKIQVEFVSANPTGPLHVGHGRGAAFGASLSTVLAACGFDVTREYYVNDAGRQMDILAISTWLRYLELAQHCVPFPPNAYQGDYVRTMAQVLFAREPERFLRNPEELLQSAAHAAGNPEAYLDALIDAAKRLLGDNYAALHEHALQQQLADCRDDLSEFGVEFDCWFSEKSLYDSGRVERVVSRLEASGHVYTEAGARWFRSTQFGDEKDRVVQRENGQYTYFASDIAYHADKIERGFDLIVDIWGADHHGYISRVSGALTALGINAEKLRIALVQFAVLYREGTKMSMSTRAGEFITLRELRQEVGNDAARFFYVLRKSDQHLDFDLDLAKSQSNDNPVYYVQYAHARVCSVLAQWSGDPAKLNDVDASPLVTGQENVLLSRLLEYPGIVASAAREFSPHLIAFFVRELSADFHSYYNSTRFLVAEENLKLARLALAVAVQRVLASALALLGVSAPEKM